MRDWVKWNWLDVSAVTAVAVMLALAWITRHDPPSKLHVELMVHAQKPAEQPTITSVDFYYQGMPLPKWIEQHCVAVLPGSNNGTFNFQSLPPNTTLTVGPPSEQELKLRCRPDATEEK
jgi:hypothetical protein